MPSEIVLDHNGISCVRILVVSGVSIPIGTPCKPLLLSPLRKTFLVLSNWGRTQSTFTAGREAQMFSFATGANVSW